MIKIKTNYVSRGQIWLMPDKKPTVGTKSHNYLILSRISENTEQVLCMGITRNLNNTLSGLIPLTCTNGQKSYINPLRIYSFHIREFVNKKVYYHGNINDDEVIDNLIDIYMNSQGFPTKKSPEEVNKIYELMQKEDNECENEISEDDSDFIAFIDDNTDSTSHSTFITKSDNCNETYDTSSLYKKHLSNWADEELIDFMKTYNAKNFILCMNKIGTRNLKTVYNKRRFVEREMKKRNISIDD